MPASPSNAGPSQFDAPQFHPEFGYLAPTVRFRRKFALIIEGAACGILLGAVAMFFATMEREEKALAMLATPMLVTPVPFTATPSSPSASVPAAIASIPTASSHAPAAPVASTPAMSTPAMATPATSTPKVSKPGSSTPAMATSTPPQTAAVRGFAPVRFVPESFALPAAAPRLPPVLNDTPPPVTVGASASASVPAQDVSAPEPPPAPLVAAAPASAPETKAVVAKPKKKIVREPHPERIARQVPPEPEPRTAFASPIRPQTPSFLRPLFGLGF